MNNTVNQEIEITSKALMTGVESCVKIVPSNECGIRFHFNNQTVEANVSNVISTDHCTTLGNTNIKIMLIEHFMAACAICHIDSLDVYLSHFEMPILDGSSKEWVELFKQNNLFHKSSKKYELTEPVYYLNGKTHLIVVPSDSFQITYSVNFNHPDLKQKWVTFNENQQEIVEARTFGYLKELEQLQAAGFAHGVTLENTVGLTEDGYTTSLRSDLEPAKHKVLDLIGDFYLTQKNPLDLNVHIIAKEAGHTVHVNLAKILNNKIREV